MKRVLATVLLAGSLGAPALAADRPLTVTIEGRPVTSGSSMARVRDGVAYARLTELVRTYNGIASTTNGATTVTVRSRRATFVPGSGFVVLGGTRMRLAHPAFTDGGVLYVPLAFFVKRVGGGRIAIDPSMSSADISIARNSGLPTTTR